MNIMLVAILLVVVVVSIYIVRDPRRGMLVVGISILMLVIIFVVKFLLNTQCRKLQKIGFGYELRRAGVSPTLNDVQFFFMTSNGKKLYGPLISGDRLTVSCRDIEKDGLPEFIIQSRVWRTAETILKIDPHSGTYHVHSTQGLNIAYPEEGYNFL